MPSGVSFLLMGELFPSHTFVKYLGETAQIAMKWCCDQRFITHVSA